MFDDNLNKNFFIRMHCENRLIDGVRKSVKINPLTNISCPKKEKKIPKVPNPIERDIHKRAFEYYYSLGENRTIAQVAERFKIKKAVVDQWSSKFRWKEKIKALKSESVEERFKKLALEIMVLFLNSLVKFDEEHGKLILTSSDKIAFQKFKILIETFKRLRDDEREEKEMEAGNLRSVQKQGVMVNVIIKK